MEGDSIISPHVPHLVISIHSLRMEGDPVSEVDAVLQSISIHSLRMEGDVDVAEGVKADTVFQSTPSTRRETAVLQLLDAAGTISIHSLHTEGDSIRTARSRPLPYFNPLPPHGGRQIPVLRLAKVHVFQSTPSTRRETHFLTQIFTVALFQSTPSTRRETVFMRDMQEFYAISIHSLHTEGDYHRVARGK